VKTHLTCPCGEAMVGRDEDELVELAQKHLSEAHPGMEYGRDAILFMAYYSPSARACSRRSPLWRSCTPPGVFRSRWCRVALVRQRRWCRR
jgi:hypothetical protein